jgi:hypothetical protein
MPDSLPELLDSRSHLLQELSQLGDFQPGSISSVTRRCGKPNCHCAQANHPGHGPHRQLTQKIAGKTVTQALSSPSAVRKAEKEIAEFRRFQALAQKLIEVNQKICRVRLWAAEEAFPVKKKTAETLHQEVSRELEHLLKRIFYERQNRGGWYSRGQGVHREVGSEGACGEQKDRAVIDGETQDEPVGPRWGKVESALLRRRRSHSLTVITTVSIFDQI